MEVYMNALKKITSGRDTRTIVMDYLIITIGSALFALSINWVFAPLNLVAGGFSGLEIIIKHVTKGVMAGGIPIWLSNIVLNAPVFIAAYALRGREFVGKTLYSAIASTFFLWCIPMWDPMNGDIILSVIYGTVIQGVGCGLVFTRYATTGGTDMVGSLIQIYKKHWHMTTVMAVLDIVIVIIGAFFFGLRSGLYATIAIVGAAFVAGRIQEGVRFAKAVYIISDKEEEIAEYIENELSRGVTYIDAEGWYSKTHRHILYTVINRKELGLLKFMISCTDKKSFVIVSDAREVFGEGWQKQEKELY